MKKAFFLLLCFIPVISFTQINDDFSDGDFTNNPSWAGDVSEFTVNTNFQLQSNGPAATSTLHLSTNSSFANNCEWRFWVRCAFNPSSSNFARIYLISNQADLEGSLNGYFIQIGGVAGSTDAIDLYRQDGNTSTKIFSGTPGHAGKNDNLLGIKVIRDASGNWSIYSDTLGGINYQLEGTTTDNTYNLSSFMGVVCTHTATRNTSFYFDDFYAGTIILDTIPPSATTVNVIDANTLNVIFSEGVTPASAQNTANYFANNGLGVPSSAFLINSNTIELVFSNSFVDGLQNTLTVQNIADYANNLMATPQNIPFTYFAPAIATENDVVFNELFPDPDPIVGLPAYEFIEIYNRSNKNLDLQGWTLSDLTSTDTLPSYLLPPNSYLILCSNAQVSIFSAYGPTLGLNNFPSLNNSSDVLTLKNANDEVIDWIAYSDTWYKDAVKKNGGWTLERVQYDIFCRDSANWSASTNPSGGTPGSQNAIFNQYNDNQAPQPVSVSIVNSTTLLLTMNEKLDSVDASNPNHYVINNGIGVAQSVNILNNGTTLELIFVNSLQISTIYELTVNNLKDCIGNINPYFVLTLGLPEPANPLDIVINEIMADPDPAVGLPNQEFVELFNTSSKIIDLNQWKFSDGSTNVSLPTFLLLPNEYVILTASANVSLFSSYGKVIGIQNFPSLNNSGDDLALYDANDVLISQAKYRDSWYKENTKKSGGWTLERINPLIACEDSANWRASENVNGGTPNAPNSVLGTPQDVLPPNFVSAYIELPSTIVITFNETFDPAAWNLTDFDLQGIGNPISYSTLDNPTLKLTFSTTFVQGTIYTLNLSKVKDCVGNQANNLSIQVGVPSPASYNDVIINEIMADPDPFVGLPEVEYVEIYNRSNKIIDVSEWTLSDNLTNGKFPTNSLLMPDSYAILSSSSAVNELRNFGSTLPLSSFPSLNNSGELIILQDKEGNLIDYVNYKDTWYGEDIKKEGGWSLERIDPNACFSENNWKASVDSSGGTPGRKNSVFGTNVDINPPKIQQILLLNPTNVLVVFNETMDNIDLTNVQLYDLQPGIGQPSQAISNLENNQVELIFPFTLDSNQVYSVNINNIKDCSGNSTNLSGQVAVPISAQKGDIIINEILYEPRTGGKRYVEIYNKTNQWLDVSRWKIGRANDANEVYQFTEVPDYLTIKPYGYIAFTQDTNNIKLEYNPPDHAVLVQTSNSLPAYDDVSDKVVLINAQDERMDEVAYSRDWHYKDLVTRQGVALERLNPEQPSQSEANWFSASSTVRFGTPGYKNSQSYQPEFLEQTFYVEPKAFSPDFDGFEDILTLHYNFTQNDNNVRITIFDSEGRIIKILKNNVLIGNEKGYFLWDGTDETGRVVQIGTYIAVMEVVNILSGDKKTFKVAFVVAKKK